MVLVWFGFGLGLAWFGFKVRFGFGLVWFGLGLVLIEIKSEKRLFLTEKGLGFGLS